MKSSILCLLLALPAIAQETKTARPQENQGLPIEALASIQTLAEARQAEIDAVLDYNIAQHRLLAALGHPR